MFSKDILDFLASYSHVETVDMPGDMKHLITVKVFIIIQLTSEKPYFFSTL
jgi:hypothetical protein